jgi:hypothetical protein
MKIPNLHESDPYWDQFTEKLETKMQPNQKQALSAVFLIASIILCAFSGLFIILALIAVCIFFYMMFKYS